MKALTLKELPDESKIFTLCWNFMKAYGVPETDDDWKKMIDDCHQCVDPYKGTIQYQFAMDMIIATVSHIERLFKEREQQKQKKQQNIA